MVEYGARNVKVVGSNPIRCNYLHDYTIFLFNIIYDICSYSVVPSFPGGSIGSLPEPIKGIPMDGSTYNIVDELKAEGDWDVLQKYAGFEFDDDAPKSSARVEYENILYLERPGCNLCMGNQEKASKGDTVMATSTRLFQGRVVADAEDKKGESLLASTPVVVLSTILGRTPSIDEYKDAVEGIDLTKFAPPLTI